MILKRHLAKLAKIAESAAANESIGVDDESVQPDPPTPPLNNGVFAKSPEFVSHVVETYHQQVASRRSTLIFCINKAMVRATTQAFLQEGIIAEAIDGNTRSDKRASIVADFNAGKFKVLVNCQVFTEGADIPSVSVMIASDNKLGLISHRSTP